VWQEIRKTFQQTVKLTQIGRLDGHVRRCRKLGLGPGQRDHGIG
jgi:hypothetical protein